MAESFSGSVKVSVSGTLSKDIDIGTVSHVVNSVFSNVLLNGTSAGKANEMFVDTRTLTASSSELLDLYGGLANGVGTTINFTSIKGIIIVADSANTNNVLVGGALTGVAFRNWVSDFSDVIVVKPGGVFCLVAPDAAGYAVVDSTGDILKVANSGGTTGVTYQIILIGTV